MKPVPGAKRLQTTVIEYTANTKKSILLEKAAMQLT